MPKCFPAACDVVILFQLDVAIVGGGVAGLASAVSLRAIAGVKATVFEAEPGFGYGGFGLALWPNGLRALRHMDVSLHDEVVRSGRCDDHVPVLSLNAGYFLFLQYAGYFLFLQL